MTTDAPAVPAPADRADLWPRLAPAIAGSR